MEKLIALFTDVLLVPVLLVASVLLLALALLPGHVTVATLGAGGALPRHVMTLLPCHAVTLRVTVTPPAAPCAALTAVRAQVARAALTLPRHGVTHPCHVIGQPRQCQQPIRGRNYTFVTLTRLPPDLRDHIGTLLHSLAPSGLEDIPLCRTEAR